MAWRSCSKTSMVTSGCQCSKRYTILDNQTDLNFNLTTGSLQHAVVSGLEFYHETYGGLKRSDPSTCHCSLRVMVSPR